MVLGSPLRVPFAIEARDARDALGGKKRVEGGDYKKGGDSPSGPWRRYNVEETGGLDIAEWRGGSTTSDRAWTGLARFRIPRVE